MKLLFTGASGFLGNNVHPLLEAIYEVTTVGLLPQDDYTVNMAQEIPELRERYDIVLHAAGKAHVTPKTKAEKQAFFDVNLQGTKKRGSPSFYLYFYSSRIWLRVWRRDNRRVSFGWENSVCHEQTSGRRVFA